MAQGKFNKTELFKDIILTYDLQESKSGTPINYQVYLGITPNIQFGIERKALVYEETGEYFDLTNKYRFESFQLRIFPFAQNQTWRYKRKKNKSQTSCPTWKIRKKDFFRLSIRGLFLGIGTSKGLHDLKFFPNENISDDTDYYNSLVQDKYWNISLGYRVKLRHNVSPYQKANLLDYLSLIVENQLKYKTTTTLDDEFGFIQEPSSRHYSLLKGEFLTHFKFQVGITIPINY